MIELVELTVGLSGIDILDDLSLTITKGEVVAVVGRSGCGKTTLVNTICGLIEPNAGVVRVHGNAVSPGAVRGIVFQEDSLLGWLTVEENILFGVSNRGASVVKEARRILSIVGLEHVRAELPRTLSVGMRRRAEFARALMLDNEFMLADEPFGPWTPLQGTRSYRSGPTCNMPSRGPRFSAPMTRTRPFGWLIA